MAAEELRRRAGEAFAKGKDEQARALRGSAADLESSEVLKTIRSEIERAWTAYEARHAEYSRLINGEPADDST